ncbi:MAG: putative DNA binding domain-containing protein, partial [Candidatus Marinimicrobia bacterium]|nr:putative DNA binding domain-containing protein [Candidatus Neomarinimicrobiota bacterium]
MKRFTDDVLIDLLDDIESDRVERKESFKGDVPKKARQAICAFANDMPGYNEPGVLFIGAKDIGEPSYIKITDQLLLSLADMKTDGNILPLPVLSVEKRLLKGAEMAVVTVMPSDMPPVRYDGRIWIRTGPRRSIANEQEERLLSERRRIKFLPYDLHPVIGASLGDLSRVFFEEEYLPRAFATDILEANGRTYEERLAACRMIVAPDDPTPTVSGILTLGRKPQDFIPGARIQFLRIKGNKWGDEVIDEMRIDGTIQNQIIVLDQKMKSHNRVSIEIITSPREIRHYHYPLSALQQLTRNAVMHRSYEGTNSPVMVYWFDDRIEIINAGGPFGRVTPENFGEPGFADYRNPNIAETMKILEFVQRFGVGIQMAQAELLKNGNRPVEFSFDSHSVICHVYSISPTSELQTTVVNDKVLDGRKQVEAQVEA